MERPALYTSKEAMEPLFPERSRPELAELTCAIYRQSGELKAHLPSRITRRQIAALVRKMNSYYSNLIEGHRTLPGEIEQAQAAHFSRNEATRNNQHLGLAHVEVEELMAARLAAEPELEVHRPEFVSWLHREFYQRLPEPLRFSAHQSGRRYAIEPGQWRDFEVVVGTHQPPHHGALESFLTRFGNFYSRREIPATDRLIAVAAAHHRLAWIHPFGDGNGRVARLLAHAGLIRCGVESDGLWTLSRGLARRRDDYYQHLSGADQPRPSDLDGRGNLSEEGLAAFCRFFLETVLDQLTFMSSLLDLPLLAERMQRHAQWSLLRLSPRDRERMGALLKAVLVEGELERGAVAGIVGLGSTAGRRIIRLALEANLVQSDTPKGPLTLVFAAETAEHYFPRLF